MKDVLPFRRRPPDTLTTKRYAEYVERQLEGMAEAIEDGVVNDRAVVVALRLLLRLHRAQFRFPGGR